MTDSGRITGWDLQLPQASLALRIGGLQAPMVVVHGPNRSGKTLLATFLAEALGWQPGPGPSWLGFAGGGARGTVTWEDAAGEVVVALRPPDGGPRLATGGGGAVDRARAKALGDRWRAAYAPGTGRCLIDGSALDFAGAIGPAVAGGLLRSADHRDQRWQARQLAMQLEAAMASLFAPAWADSPAHRLRAEARRATELAAGNDPATAATRAATADNRARLAAEIAQHTAELQQMTAELGRFESVPPSADLDGLVTALDELERLLGDDGHAGGGTTAGTRPQPGSAPWSASGPWSDSGPWADSRSQPDSAPSSDSRSQPDSGSQPDPGSQSGPWSAISSAVASDRAASEAAARAAETPREGPGRRDAEAVEETPPPAPAPAASTGPAPHRPARRLATWLQPTMLVLTAVGILVAISLLVADRSRAAAVVGGLAVLAAGVSFLAPTRREAKGTTPPPALAAGPTPPDAAGPMRAVAAPASMPKQPPSGVAVRQPDAEATALPTGGWPAPPNGSHLPADAPLGAGDLVPSAHAAVGPPPGAGGPELARPGGTGPAGTAWSGPSTTATVESTTEPAAAARGWPEHSAASSADGRSARLAELAVLVQLPPGPGPADVARRRAEVDAHRVARREADDLVAASAAATQRLADAHQRLAALDRQLETIERAGSGGQPGPTDAPATTASVGHAIDHRLSAAVFHQRFVDVADRWQTYALARQLLFDALVETDRSLAAPLERRAARHLRAFTDGAWTDLAVDAGGVDLVDRHGVHRDVRTVGSGVARLATLSLRLALAHDDDDSSPADLPPVGGAAEDGVGPASGGDGDRPAEGAESAAMPLLVDDVALGLDEVHQAAVVRHLGHLSEHRQVVLFTNDASLGDLARRHRRGVRVLELR